MKTFLCFFCLSFCGWVWMVVEFVKLWRFKAKAKAETVMAKGVITSYEKKQKSWGRSIVNVYYPVITFSVSSHEYRVISKYYYPEVRNLPTEQPPMGSEVVLFYNPSDPYSIHLQMEERGTGIGHFRLGLYIIAFSAVVSIVAGLILKW